MARNTRLKLAALATTLVATIGMVAIAPSTGADAGKTTTSYKGPQFCC